MSVIIPVTLALLIAAAGVASAFIPLDAGVGGEKVREYDIPVENKAEGFSLSGLYPWTLYHNEKSEALSSYPSYPDKKQELDSLSTCDMNAVINNGLSDASLEQLKDRTGEEIVDADIKGQLSINN